MVLHFKQLDDFIIVLGQTYHHKEAIKALGGRFNKIDKVWNLPNNEDVLTEVEKLCNTAGGGRLEHLGSASNAIKDDLHLNSFDPSPILAADFPTYSIHQLVSKVHLAVAKAFPQFCWITAEIQNLNKRQSGIFFQLAEQKFAGRDTATIALNATLWWSQYKDLCIKYRPEKLDEILQPDLQVKCLCQVGFYKDRGQVSLTVVDLDLSYTKGALALAKEALLKELRQRGLDRTNKSLSIPAFPLRVGLITADDSRAKSDFCHQLEQYGFCGKIIFESASMQGEELVKSIVTALNKLQDKNIDIVVITRGGGSAADLRWFDDKTLAYAVAQYPIPVIAAIGHHDDRCVIEEICYQRQKTPTAAADFIIDCFTNTINRIEDCAQRIAKTCRMQLENNFERNLALKHKLYKAAKLRLERVERTVTELSYTLQQSYHHLNIETEKKLQQILNLLYQMALNKIYRASEYLTEREKQLIALDPKPWMKNGWTQLMTDQGVIKSINNCATNQVVRARLIDGSLKLIVTEKKGE